MTRGDWRDGISAEWFRVVEFSRPLPGRLLFLDQQTAEVFARFLRDEGAELVVLEHWREGELVDSRLVESAA